MHFYIHVTCAINTAILLIDGYQARFNKME